MSRIQFTHSYEDIISVENLLGAWKEFVRGKRKKQDVLEFQYRLMENILALHRDLAEGTYVHGSYHAFNISDPKPRNIHKATVCDRLLHHALYRKLYSFFDCTFIADSYSCRKGKGTHRAMNRFRSFVYKASRNHTRTCWVLKCDVRKFFASIDQALLMQIVASRVPDKLTIDLIAKVVGSFDSDIFGKGLPLGNLTSQLLVNIYMNEFDKYVKHSLGARYYIRYADDFVFLSHNRKELAEILPHAAGFLLERLKLELHPKKISISTLASGVDFLGWVHFSDHRILRTTTKRLMFKNCVAHTENAHVRDSYLGLLSHGNAHTLQTLVRRIYSHNSIGAD